MISRDDVLAHLHSLRGSMEGKTKLTGRGGEGGGRGVPGDPSGFLRFSENRNAKVSLESPRRIRLSGGARRGRRFIRKNCPPFRRGADSSRALSGRRYPRPVKLRRGRPARRRAPCNFTIRGPLSVRPVYFPQSALSLSLSLSLFLSTGECTFRGWRLPGSSSEE